MLFAVERYDDSGVGERPELPGAAARASGSRRRSTCLRTRSCLALVDGPDETSVGAAVVAAGWRVDRISPAQWLSPAPNEVLT